MFLALISQVEAPKAEPKLTEPFWGFTRTAETWNSRVCMVGLIGTFIVELVGASIPPPWLILVPACYLVLG